MRSAVRTKPPKLSRELQAFCRRLGILRYVPVALGLLEECFPNSDGLRLYSSADPESGEEWLVVDIRVSGSFKEVDRQYRVYTQRKIELLPVKYLGAIRLHHKRV